MNIKHTIIIQLTMTITCLIYKTTNAQTGTYSTINFPHVYTNTITTSLYTANPRSGFVFQSNGSLNFGMTGPKNVNFKFRWLAHDDAAVNYLTDADQLMYLTGYGDLWVKTNLFVANGKVGIGTTSPAYPLDVNGTIKSGYSFMIIRPGYNPSSIMTSNLFSSGPSTMLFSADNFEFRTASPSSKLAILNDGNILIGTQTDDGQSKLQVNGTVKAQKLKITQTGWSDFVFAPTYILTPLSDIAAFITEYHHLPGIPSKDEIVQQGLDIGTIEQKQMQKIEELTLYLIKQQHEIDTLKSILTNKKIKNKKDKTK